MYNKEFQIIDTEEKAYFLGQAFGDGCNQYESHYKFNMVSTKKDIDLYSKIQSYFPFLKLVQYSSHPNVICLEYYRKDFCLDLKKLGLTQNKSKQDKEGNFNIPNISDDLMPHFIRGLFDADGSVYTPVSRYRSRNNIRVEFGMSTINFCNQLCLILDKIGIKYRCYSVNKSAGNGKKYPSKVILITSRKESLKFADYIYKDATIYLSRKREVFYTYKKSDLQKLRGLMPDCPKCGGKPRMNGTRNGRKRLICKQCNHHYDVLLPDI